MFDVLEHSGKFVLTLLIAALLAVSALALGCGGGNTPESAVNQYFDAWQSGDWEAFKDAVVPQKLTEDQEALAEEKFKQVKVKVDGLKMSTEYDKDDSSKASVVLTDGKITWTAKILGKTQTDVEDIKKEEKEFRTYNVIKVDGVWYVDTKLG
jgi:hypothetical protein